MAESALAKRARLMQEGYSYAEAQAAIMIDSGHEVVLNPATEEYEVLDQRATGRTGEEMFGSMDYPGGYDFIPAGGEPPPAEVVIEPAAGSETSIGGAGTMIKGGVTMPTNGAGTQQQYLDLLARQGAAGSTTGYVAGAEEVEGTPMALPLLAGLAGIAGMMSIGLFKTLLVRFGPLVLKGIIGAAAFKEFMDLIGIGAPDNLEVKVAAGKKKRKRYSIGSNPRVGTLAKVSRHCKRMLVRHEKVIKEFLPKPRKATYGMPPYKMLSPVERKLLKEG